MKFAIFDIFSVRPIGHNHREGRLCRGEGAQRSIDVASDRIFGIGDGNADILLEKKVVFFIVEGRSDIPDLVGGHTGYCGKCRGTRREQLLGYTDVMWRTETQDPESVFHVITELI